VDDVPVLTFPNARLVPLNESVCETATPVPLNATVVGELGELLTMLTEPARLPAVVGANTALNVALAPAAIVVELSPFTVYPAALMLSCEIVSEAVPEFVIVNDCDFVCPSMTLPKLKLAGLTVTAACTPVPVSGIVRGEPVPLLVTVTVPVAAPTAVGANVTDRVAWLEGFSVAGAVMPLAANPAPDTVTPVICSDPVPEFVSTICFTELVPVPTFPKLKLLALACRVPVGVAVPVPLNATVSVGFVGSLLVMERLPVAAAAVVGLKDKDTAADWPALMTFGTVIPLYPKAVPETDTPEIVRSDPPAFDMVRLEVPCDPTTMLPKLIELLLKEICCAAETPVAAKFTTAGALPESPCTESVPFTAPLVVGVTLTVTVPDCPAAIDIGRLIPLTVNCELETVACVIVTEAVPALEIVTVLLLALPRGTLPKLTEAGFN